MAFNDIPENKTLWIAVPVIVPEETDPDVFNIDHYLNKFINEGLAGIKTSVECARDNDQEYDTFDEVVADFDWGSAIMLDEAPKITNNKQ